MALELNELFKNSYSQLFSILYSRFRDIDLVEDAVQDAYEKALQNWIEQPANPIGWLLVTARNKILDAKKRSSAKDAQYIDEEYVAGRQNHENEPLADASIDDAVNQQLRLICMCCHPALSKQSQILLTLKLVSGLTVDEIAPAFFMKPKTVSQSLYRAKDKIRRARIPFTIPDESHLPARLEAIQSVIYLTFNEGYHSNSEHSLLRDPLCFEAIQLTRMLLTYFPDNTQIQPLLALLLYQASRIPARQTPDGEPILLKDQNRALWIRENILEANAIMERLFHHEDMHFTAYFYQAAIAREYARTNTFAETNWQFICRLYSDYYYSNPDPVVLLSWISAESQRTNADHALQLLQSSKLESHLKEYRWFYSIRGELYSETGQTELAICDLKHSLELSSNPGEQRLLRRRLNEIQAQASSSKHPSK